MDNYEELKKLIKEKSELEKQLEKLQNNSPKVTIDENGQVNTSEVNSAVDYSDQIKFLPTHIKDLQGQIDHLADEISKNENKTKEDILKEVNDQIEKEKQERIDLNNLLKDLFYYKTYANYLNETSKKASEFANETDKPDTKRNFLKWSDSYHKQYEKINKILGETYNKILETKKFTSKEDVDNYLAYDISIVPFIQYLLNNNYITDDTTVQLFNKKIKDIATKKDGENQIIKSFNDLKDVCFLIQNSEKYFKEYIDEYQDTVSKNASKDETTVLPKNNEETTVLDRNQLKKSNNNSNDENIADLNKKTDVLLDKLMDRKLNKDERRTFVIDYMHLIDVAHKIGNEDLAKKMALDFNNTESYYEFGEFLEKIKNTQNEDEINKLIEDAKKNIQDIKNANDDAYNNKNALADLLTNELNDVLKEKEQEKAKVKKIEEDQNIANNDGNSYFVVDNGGSYDIIPAGFNVLDLSKKQETIDKVNDKYNLNLTLDNTNLYAFGVKQNDKMIYSGEHTYYESIGDYVTLFGNGNKKIMLLGEKTINKQTNEAIVDNSNIDNPDIDNNSDTKNPYETVLMNPDIKKKGKLKLIKDNINNVLKKHPVITKIAGAVAGVAIVAALSSNIVSCVRNQMQTPDQNPTIEQPQNNDDNKLDKSQQLIYAPVNEHYKVYTSKYLENESDNSMWFAPFRVLDVFDENGDLVINNPTEEDLEKLESTGKNFVCRCIGVNKTSTGYGYEGYIKLSTVTNFAKNGLAYNYDDLVNHYDEIPNLREFDQLGKKGKTL